MDIDKGKVRKYRFKTLFKSLDRSTKIINEFSEFLKLLDLRDVGILRAMMVRFMIEATNADAGGLIDVTDREYRFSEIFQYRGNRVMDKDFSPMISKIQPNNPEYTMIETVIKREVPTLFMDENIKDSILGEIVNVKPSFIILTPIVVNDKVTYIVELLKKERKRCYHDFSEEHIQSLSIISNIASAIFTNAELFNRAIHDNLTGLYNIHYFKNVVYEEMVKVKKFGTKFSLAIIDLDHFKQINDTYGHSVGDETLKFFANILRQEIKRSSDIIARYGGDEFVIGFPSTDINNAYLLCSRLRDRVNNERFYVNEKLFLTLTPSIGVAEIPTTDIDNSSTPVELFRKVFIKADTALYNSKKTGRNKVTIYTEGLPLIEEREI
ncbi:MAG: GGDEF domain-containing protein [Brevinematia bacterium]